jgi:hypothetical protein
MFPSATTCLSSERVRYDRPPSPLDPWVIGDTWVSLCGSNRCLVLYLNNQPVHVIAGLPFDQPSLNSRLYELRSRSPRPAFIPPVA